MATKPGKAGQPGKPGSPGTGGGVGGVGGAGGQGGQGSAAQPVLKALRWLIFATVVLYVALGTTTTILYLNTNGSRHDIAAVAAQTLAVQCSQRVNLQRQRDDSERYLRDVQSGKRTRIPGISDSDILLRINRIKDTLVAYEGLACPTP